MVIPIVTFSLHKSVRFLESANSYKIKNVWNKV